MMQWQPPFGSDETLPDDVHEFLTEQLKLVLGTAFDALGGTDPRDVYMRLCQDLRRLGEVEWCTPHGKALRARKQTSLEAKYLQALGTDAMVMTEAVGHITAGTPVLAEVVLTGRVAELRELPRP